jgi:hypothetical protein
MKSLLLSTKKSKGCAQVQLKRMKFNLIKAALVPDRPCRNGIAFQDSDKEFLNVECKAGGETESN